MRQSAGYTPPIPRTPYTSVTFCPARLLLSACPQIQLELLEEEEEVANRRAGIVMLTWQPVKSSLRRSAK